MSRALRLIRGLSQFPKLNALTGWRKSEIASLRWSNFDGVCLRLGDSQTGEQRVLPFNMELSELMERRLKVQCGPFIFHRNGHPIKHIRRSWNTACKKAGLDGRLFHDTRRSAVRNLIQQIPERHVMLITGDKTRHMLERYHIISERDLMDVWRNFGGDPLASAKLSPQPLIFLSGGVSVLVCRMDFKPIRAIRDYNKPQPRPIKSDIFMMQVLGLVEAFWAILEPIHGQYTDSGN